MNGKSYIKTLFLLIGVYFISTSCQKENEQLILNEVQLINASITNSVNISAGNAPISQKGC